MAPWITDTHLLLVLSSLLESARGLPENNSVFDVNASTASATNSPNANRQRVSLLTTTAGIYGQHMASMNVSNISAASPSTTTSPNASLHQNQKQGASATAVSSSDRCVAATVRSIDISKCRYVSADTVLLILSDLVRVCPKLETVTYDRSAFEGNADASVAAAARGGGSDDEAIGTPVVTGTGRAAYATSPVRGHDSYPASPNLRSLHRQREERQRLRGAPAAGANAVKSAATILEDALAERAIAAARM